MALTLEVLSIDRLSAKSVKDRITEIRAEENNVIVFWLDAGAYARAGQVLIRAQQQAEEQYIKDE